MPLARLRVELYGTAAQLAAARSQVTSQYPNANRIFDRNDGTISPAYQDIYALTMDCRLKNKTDGDALFAKGANIVTALRSAGVTGRVTYHQCTHMDPVVVTCEPTVLVV